MRILYQDPPTLPLPKMTIVKQPTVADMVVCHMTKWQRLAGPVQPNKTAPFKPVPGDVDEVRFIIMDEPEAQNGYKLRWKGVKIPFCYDPMARKKMALKKAIVRALYDDGITTVPLFEECYLQVEVEFYLPLEKKDLDNMAKFLLDSMEGIIYPDDKRILKLVLSKFPSAPAGRQCRVKITRSVKQEYNIGGV